MKGRAAEEMLALDAQWIDALRCGWLELIKTTVWSELHGARPGAIGRLRKRALEIGERLRSLAAARDWIPRPRERLKSARACALGMDEGLAALEEDVHTLKGGYRATEAGAGATQWRVGTAPARIEGALDRVARRLLARENRHRHCL